MDHLPVELIIKILHLACFDDKLTGCFLSLVSKWVRDAIESFQFEAISLHGLAQVAGFALHLRGLPKETSPRYRIKHLFVSGLPVADEEKKKVKRNENLKRVAIGQRLIARDGDDPDREGDGPFPEPASDNEDSETLQAQEALELVKAFHAIVQYSSPHLQTLFIAISPHAPMRTHLKFTYPLPNLIDLSATPAGWIFELRQIFPKLRRIHTTSGLRGYGDQHTVDFRVTAPVLEQLRLSEVSFEGLWLPAAFMQPAGVEQGCGLLFPETLQRVLIQPGAWPIRREIPVLPHSLSCLRTDFLRASSLIAKSSRSYQLILLEEFSLQYWLDGKGYGLEYCFEDARRDWLDVISGQGQGSWDDQYALVITA